MKHPIRTTSDQRSPTHRRLLILLGVLGSLAVFLLSSAVLQAWRKQPLDISNYGGGDYYPAVFVNPTDDKSHIVWGQENNPNLWVINYVNNVSGGFNPPVSLSGGINARPFGLTDAAGRVYTDNGNPIGGSWNFQQQVRIAGRGNPLHLYVIFEGYPVRHIPPTEIYFTESIDGGTSWSAAQPLSPLHSDDGADRYTPALTVLPNGNVYVVYNRGNSAIILRTRMAHSTTWSEEQVINPGFKPCPSYPNIAYTKQNGQTYLHLTAAANDCVRVNGILNDDLFYTRFAVGGNSWSNATILSVHPYQSEYNYLVTDLVQNIYVADTDTNTGPIRFNYSTDNGATWTGSRRVARGVASFPSLAYEGDGVLDLSYQADIGKSSSLVFKQFYQGRWHDAASPWGNTCEGKPPALAAGTNNVVVVFHAMAVCENGNYEIYFNSQKKIPTSTPTNTPTNTPTATNTPEPGVTPTLTNTPTPTLAP